MKPSEKVNGKKDYFTLEDIISQLTTQDDNNRSEVYTTKAALRERFKKLLAYMKMDANSLKNEKKEIFFYQEDVPFVKALLIELGEPYLQRLTSNKMAGSIVECIAEATAFRERMTVRMENANPEPETRKSWEGTIEILSRRQLLQVQNEIMNKIKYAGDRIFEKDLAYADHVNLLTEVNNAIDMWMKKQIINE